MKLLTLLVVALLGGCASLLPAPPKASDWARLPVLGPLEAGLLYGQWAGQPVEPRLAYAWGEVCGELDPGARAVALDAAVLRLEGASSAAWAQPTWRIPLRRVLGAYDPKQGGFPSGLRTGAVVRFDRGDFCRQDLTFLVAFRNGDAFSISRLTEEAAKRFIRGNPARSVVHDLEVEVVGWQAGPPAATLVVDVRRLRTRDERTDEVLFDSALGRAGEAR